MNLAKSQGFDSLAQVGARPLGVVLNKVPAGERGYGYYAYGTYRRAATDLHEVSIQKNGRVDVVMRGGQVLFENAYAATARVIQTVDSLFDILLGIGS